MLLTQSGAHRPDEDLVSEWPSSVSVPDLFVSEALEAHVMQPQLGLARACLTLGDD